MTLPNRVDPFGKLHPSATRGQMMGNRGGRFHSPQKTLTTRRWASKQWICCVCDFRGRQRDVWGQSYTELFFLDEVTALASGHRPCFECRNGAAREFQAVFAKPRLKAGEMDLILHQERLGPARSGLVHDLPDGSMFALAEQAFGVRGGQFLPWSFAGYGPAVPILRNTIIKILTPPSIIAALRAGFQPVWHRPAHKTMGSSPSP